MFDQMSNNQFQFNDDNFNPPNPIKQLKLPQINRNSSRNSSSNFQRSNKKFPSLKLDSTPNIYENASEPSEKTPTYTTTNNIKKNQIIEQQDDFVIEIQKKLKMVLEKQNVNDIQQSYGESDDDEDFQRKINQNKEIIKMHKQKKQSDNMNGLIGNNNIQLLQNKNKPVNKKQTINKRTRNQSLYEKRARQYRDASSENKYLIKKKQNVAIKIFKQTGKQIIKQTKSKQGLGFQNKLPLNLPPPSRQMRQNKIQLPPGMGKLQFQQQPYTNQQIIKNQQLFDNIQSFLENPKKSDQQLFPLKAISARNNKKQQLQQKIRQIEQRLAEDKKVSISTQKQSTISPEVDSLDNFSHAGILQWKRVQLNNGQVKHIETNFDKQMDRISHYLQKNESSIQRYVQNQKLLLEMQFWKKGQFKTQSFKSPTRNSQQS